MGNELFTGVCTALVTPFINGCVNYPMMEVLIKRQIDAGIPAVVISGTTGESPTLSDDEKLEMIRRAKRYAAEKCLIIAGTGSNNTDHAVLLSKAAESAGADALLIVSPYYNKSTPDGLIKHYSTIASAVHIPIILYNVPSRTGVDIPVSVYQYLAQIPNIIGTKEASNEIAKVTRIKAALPHNFSVWSGNDDQAAAVMSLGGSGLISVLSNILPIETQAMVSAALNGDFDTASDLQIQMMPLIDLLFSEVNPIPVKTAMKLIGYDCGDCRLPLTTLSHDNFSKLKNVIRKYSFM